VKSGSDLEERSQWENTVGFELPESEDDNMKQCRKLLVFGGALSLVCAWGSGIAREADQDVAPVTQTPVQTQSVGGEQEPAAERPRSASQDVADRQICRLEKPIGSNRKVRVCRSVAQIQSDRDEAVEDLRSYPDRRLGDP